MRKPSTEFLSFSAFTIVSALALVKLLRQPVPGHFRVFSGAGHAIWHGLNPYATDFGTGVGYFFYSPFCAMTIFGPISALPEKLGILVYILTSWAVFVWGARAFWRAFVPKEQRGPGWFWVAISPQLFGGILASKLEVLICGMLLLSLAWLAERARKPSPMRGKAIWACALIAATLNWKFQSLPLIGLVGLSWLMILRDWKFPAAIAAFVAFFTALPFAILDREYLQRSLASWSTSFTQFVAVAYLDFENVFAFLHNAFGIPFSFLATQVISGIVGLSFAAFTLVWITRHPIRDEASKISRMAGAILLSTALGTAFTTALSPLGQNNALTLYAPLLLVGFICHAHAETKRAQQYWKIALLSTFLGMTLVYSDAVPVDLRNHLRHLAVKPLFCLGLAALIARESWRERGFFNSSRQEPKLQPQRGLPTT